MVVTKLLSFINHNKRLWSVKRPLEDTTLIIDSTCLLYHFNEKACLNDKSPNYRVDVYGGNLIGFSRIVREFFEELASVRVKPIVVIQGSPINDCQHEQTRRERERILQEKGLGKLQDGQLAQERGSGENCSFTPQLFKIVYRQILAELGVKTIQAVNNSRKLIAKLASDLKCPVLATNSEYILFPVEEYINLKNLYIKNRESNIDCHVIQQELFLDYFSGLKRESLPLLNALLGNHRVISETFIERLLEVDQEGGDELSLAFPEHLPIKIILRWLSRHSLEDAIELILENEMPEDREQVQIFIDETLAAYDTASNLVQLETVLEKLHERSSSKYLLQLFNGTYLSDALLDIVLDEPHFDNSFLDDHSQPSSNRLKFRPYSVAMALLRPEPLREGEPEERVFTVYTRSDGDYLDFRIKPMRELEHFGPLDPLSWSEVVALPRETKAEILMSTFRFNREQCNQMLPLAASIFTDQPLVEELTLCMMLVKYFTIEANLLQADGDEGEPPLAEAFISALTLTIVYYADRSTQLDVRTLPRLRANNMYHKLKRHSYMNSREKYSDDPRLYRRIMHQVSSLQAAYECYSVLNNLLGRPGHVPDLRRWFNGALIYRVTKLTVERELSLEELGKDLDEFVTNCHRIGELVVALV